MFRDHSDKLGATHVYGEMKEFVLDGSIKKIVLDNGEEFQSRAVIIATGATSRRLDVAGESKLQGMGVSYCATCDGAFFRGKTVAVVGGGDVAIEDAIFLARICKQVHVIHRRDEFRAAKTLCTKLFSLENITIHWNSKVEEILGDEKVTGINIYDTKKEVDSSLVVDGVFIAVGNIPNSTVYADCVALDKNGYIIAGEDCETSIPGVFAAGDIRTKRLRQVITAAADGAVAVTGVEHYLNELNIDK